MDTTVPMVSDERLPRKVKHKQSTKRLATALSALWGGLIVVVPLSAMADWKLSPKIELAETYSSNITLRSVNPEEEYITSLNPGIDLAGKGGRAQLDLSYNMQNLFYARESGRNQTNHQLQGNGKAELIKDWFFLEGNASISQTIINPALGLGADNLNISNNRGDVVTTGITPILRHSIGTFAQGELRYSHQIINYDGFGASDATIDQASASLSNGRHAAHLFWGLIYDRTRQDYQLSADTDRKRTEGHLQYRPRRWISVVGYAGREEGTMASRQSFAEGNYWSAGIIWEPTPRWLFEGATGKNEDRGRIEWTPTGRTAFKVSYKDRTVGITPGKQWDASFQHRTRRSHWNLSYNNQITSDILLLSETQLQAMSLTMGSEEFKNLKRQGSPFLTGQGIFLLSDEQFERARTQLTTTFDTGKTLLSVSGFHENRYYQLTPRDETADGGSVTADWKIAARTRLSLGHNVVMYKAQTTGKRESRISTIALNRTISSRANAWLDYRHAKEYAENNVNKYIENRLSLHFAVTF